MNRSFFIGVGLTAILACGVIFWLLRKNKVETDGLASLIETDKGQITFHQNKVREAIASATQARISLQGYKDTHPEEVAAILKEFGLRPSQLKSYLKASFKAENKGVSVLHTVHYPDTTTLQKGDSITDASFDISDGYLTLHGDTRTQVGMPWLKVNWEYSYSDTLSFVGRTQRKTLFAKQTYWVDAMVKNPNAQITSLRNVQITEFRDKRFSVGPGILFDPFSGKAVVGFGITYGLFKF